MDYIFMKNHKKLEELTGLVLPSGPNNIHQKPIQNNSHLPPLSASFLGKAGPNKTSQHTTTREATPVR
jgi:hypothetical protein